MTSNTYIAAPQFVKSTNLSFSDAHKFVMTAQVIGVMSTTNTETALRRLIGVFIAAFRKFIVNVCCTTAAGFILVTVSVTNVPFERRYLALVPATTRQLLGAPICYYVAHLVVQ